MNPPIWAVLGSLLFHVELVYQFLPKEKKDIGWNYIESIDQLG